MPWQYRIMRFPGGTVGRIKVQPCLGIVESYFKDDPEQPWGYTEPLIVGDDLDGLRWAVDRIREALDQPAVDPPGPETEALEARLARQLDHACGGAKPRGTQRERFDSACAETTPPTRRHDADTDDTTTEAAHRGAGVAGAGGDVRLGVWLPIGSLHLAPAAGHRVVPRPHPIRPQPGPPRGPNRGRPGSRHDDAPGRPVSGSKRGDSGVTTPQCRTVSLLRSADEDRGGGD